MAYLEFMALAYTVFHAFVRRTLGGFAARHLTLVADVVLRNLKTGVMGAVELKSGVSALRGLTMFKEADQLRKVMWISKFGGTPRGKKAVEAGFVAGDVIRHVITIHW